MARDRGRQQNGGWVALVIVGVIAFLLGRTSNDAGAEAGSAYPVDEAVSLVSVPEGGLAGETPDPAPRSFYQAEPAAASYTYFANCSEARAAGAAPVHAGDPGYAMHLDRDRDGVGCE